MGAKNVAEVGIQRVKEGKPFWEKKKSKLKAQSGTSSV